MEENQKVDEQYKKWFNRGYELRQQFPDIFKGMKTPENEPKEITQAFEAGVKEFEREHAREQLREQMNARSQERDRGFDRGS